MKEIYILIAGEDKVGKSTLITSLIKDTFVQDVQPIIPEITIPPEVSIENVTTHVVDSSSKIEYREQLNHDIRKADVICILYSCVDRESFTKIPDFWFNYLREKDIQTPIILVGTKNDLKTSEDIPTVSFEDEVLPLMQLYRNVEAALETSSKLNHNINELFYTAQRAVLYPITPIYDTIEKTLTSKCIDALKRIFALIDSDKDGLLNDNEINAFQKKCFGTPLSSYELDSIKETISMAEPLGVSQGMLTVFGFLYLHALFVSRARTETVWSVLRKYGYNESLELDKDLVFPNLEIPPNHTVELSPNGYQFFIEIFKAYDKDNDGALNDAELQALFNLCPGAISHPWQKTEFPSTTVTNSSGSVTLQGFLAQWSLTTLQDPQTTLAYLAYLGYEGDTLKAIKFACNDPLPQVSKPRKGIRVTKKNVFSCYVLGGAGCGKTSILRSFVKKPFVPEYKSTKHPFSVVNAVDVLGAEKYLVLEELGTNYESVILRNPQKLEQCDLICLVYDSNDPNSFLNIIHFRERYNIQDLPYVIVATKSDLETVRQRMDLQPEEYCLKNKIAMPIRISVKDSDLASLFNLFASVAMDRRGNIPGLNDSRRKRGGFGALSTPIRFFTYALLSTAFLSGSYFLYKALRPYSHTLLSNPVWDMFKKWFGR